MRILFILSILIINIRGMEEQNIPLLTDFQSDFTKLLEPEQIPKFTRFLNNKKSKESDIKELLSLLVEVAESGNKDFIKALKDLGSLINLDNNQSKNLDYKLDPQSKIILDSLNLISFNGVKISLNKLLYNIDIKDITLRYRDFKFTPHLKTSEKKNENNK